jgi:Spy/CpxP family protein refolding chaperone
MMKSALVALALTVLPGAALAQSSPGPGSGTDLQRVQREMEQMMRDGRYQRLLDEGRANREAFERLRQQDTVSSTVAPPRMRRRP